MAAIAASALLAQGCSHEDDAGDTRAQAKAAPAAGAPAKEAPAGPTEPTAAAAPLAADPAAKEAAPGAAADAGAATAAAPPATQPLAAIKCTADVHDFGKVWQGAELAHEFEFTAAGDAPLSIISVRPDCGCTLAHLDIVAADGTRSEYKMNTPVEPGTRFALAVSLDTKGRDGRQARAIKIYGNVPDGVREMTIQADVRPFLTVDPRVQALGTMSKLESRETEFTVKSVDGERFGLRTTGLGLPPQVTVDLQPSDPDDKGRSATWKVTAKLGAGMPTGIRSYTLDLATDLVNKDAPRTDGGEPVYFMVQPMLNARIVGPVSAMPENLNFGMVAPGMTVAKVVVVESHDESFELPEPRTEIKPYREGASLAFADTLRITKRRAIDKKAWEIELLLEGLSEEVGRSFLGKLVIETGHPDEPTLEVTLSGIKQGG